MFAVWHMRQFYSALSRARQVAQRGKTRACQRVAVQAVAAAKKTRSALMRGALCAICLRLSISPLAFFHGGWFRRHA